MTEQIYTPQDIETVVAVLKLIQTEDANKARQGFTGRSSRPIDLDDEETKRIIQDFGEAIVRSIEKQQLWGK